MIITEKIELLSDYFSSLGERFDLFYSVEKGTFVTGSIKHVHNGLLSLIHDDKIIAPGQTFIDAGSGDGRICAIASFLGLQSYGIEYNETIVESSLENIQHLVTQDILSTQEHFIPIITQGDLLDDGSYKKLGINFEDIHIFFNFVTYHEDLTQKISIQSPVGTIFILHSPCPISFKPEGFDLIKAIPLSSIYQVLYVYKKN